MKGQRIEIKKRRRSLHKTSMHWTLRLRKSKSPSWLKWEQSCSRTERMSRCTERDSLPGNRSPKKLRKHMVGPRSPYKRKDTRSSQKVPVRDCCTSLMSILIYQLWLIKSNLIGMKYSNQHSGRLRTIRECPRMTDGDVPSPCQSYMEKFLYVCLMNASNTLKSRAEVMTSMMQSQMLNWLVSCTWPWWTSQQKRNWLWVLSLNNEWQIDSVCYRCMKP